MKKITFILIVALFLLSPSSERARKIQPYLLEGESGLVLYEEFLDTLSSAEVSRTDISFDSWYKFVSFTSEQICFQRGEDGKQKLTYTVREPFVFWNYPPPSYYDGKNYYYSYNGTWFVDTHNRFKSYLQRDFMGIPTSILTTYPIVSDKVYQIGEQYEILITARAGDGSEQYQIAAELGADKQFEQIQITVTDGLSSNNPNYRHFYRIRYAKVNQPIEIKPPAGFDPEKVIGGGDRK